MKSKFTEQRYYQLYPTGSNVGKFYGTAKVLKLKQGDTVDQLSLQPTVSNYGTASYRIYYRIYQPIKKQMVPSNCKMISFDIISLFTNVPMDTSIDTILKRIYKQKKN